MGAIRKGGSPTIHSDSLRSGQILRIIDVLGEGEIYGLKTGDLQSVYINDAKVMNEDGSFNVEGVQYETREGTQGQAPLLKIPSTEREVSVGVDITTTNAHTVTITSVNTDRLRVTLGVKSLVKSNDEGDRKRTSVNMKIFTRIAGGERVEVQDVDISGKTMTQYLRSYVLDLPEQRPIDIIVERTTADSTSDLLQNDTLWSSYTEITDSRLAYPNTAIVGIEIDSEQFSGDPSRNYLVRGMLVNVPKNYNPETREYTGFWNGEFKKAWTNNPAWILYDLLTNARYGLGERIGVAAVDKVKLYQIGQYCDQDVPSGYMDDAGNEIFEPRMTLNCAITDSRSAYEVINDICSVFRGMPVWDGVQMSATLDITSDPVCQYTNANVVDGKFTYKSSALKARHTAVEVEYTHGADNTWDRKVEFIQDDAGVARFGYNVNKIQAFGCTSRGQARRAGRFILETERLERQTVMFASGKDALANNVGDIIEVADNTHAGVKLGGRIKSVSTDKRTIELDREVENIVGGTMAIIGEDGQVTRFEVQDQIGATLLQFQYEVPSAKPGAVWTLSSQRGVKPRLFRCMSIAENDDGTFAIDALEHEPLKNIAIDSGYIFEPEPDTAFGGKLQPVIDLVINADEGNEYNDGWRLRATWRTQKLFNNVKFRCEVKTESGLLVQRQDVDVMEFTHSALEIGEYTLSVQPLTSIGQLGERVTVSFSIAPPATPKELSISPDVFAIYVRAKLGAAPIGTLAECYYSDNEADMADPERLATRFPELGNLFVDYVGTADTDRWYAVRAKNPIGVSDWVKGKGRTLSWDAGVGGLIGEQFPEWDWIDTLKDLKTHAYLAVQSKDGAKGGVFVDGETDNLISINFVADQIGFTSPDNYNDPLLYWDATNPKAPRLTLKGKLVLADGKVVDNAEDIKGEKGDAGSSAYTWTAYAKSLSGSGISATPSPDRKYIGYAYNKTTPTPTLNPSLYVWSKYSGDNGAAGAPGAGFYRYKVSAIAWDKTTTDNIMNTVAGRKPVKDDVLTQYKTDNTEQTKRYTGTSWAEAALLIHGDMIAEGTIVGDRIRANTEISSPQIVGGRLMGGIIKGGRAGVGLNNASGYPLGDGSEKYNTVILEDGTLKTNRLQADSGTFKGDISGATGTFSGTISAEHIIGDLVSATAVDLNQSKFTTGWKTYGSFRVDNNTGTTATLAINAAVVNLHYSLRTSSAGSHSITINTRILKDGSVVSSSSSSFGGASGSAAGDNYGTAISAGLSQTIAKNGAGTYQIQGMMSSSSGGGHSISIIKLQFGQTATNAELFRDGGAFSAALVLPPDPELVHGDFTGTLGIPQTDWEPSDDDPPTT